MTTATDAPELQRRPGVGQPAVDRGIQHLAEQRLEQRQQRLRLRVTEACVELDHPYAARGERQPGIEKTHERHAAPSKLCYHGRSTAAATSSTSPDGAHGSGV